MVKGTWWRVFGIGIVFIILMSLLGSVAGFPIGIIGQINPYVGNIAGSLAGIFLFPIAPIAATLVYFDLRVRKEQSNLSQMAAEAAA